MQYEQLIDPQDVPRAHSMIVVGLRGAELDSHGLARVARAFCDTTWLADSGAQLMYAACDGDISVIAYMPLGAVSDLLVSAEIAGVPLGFEVLTECELSIESAAWLSSDGIGSGVRMWSDGRTSPLSSCDGVEAALDDWCVLATGSDLPSTQIPYRLVSRFPVPHALTSEWTELGGGGAGQEMDHGEEIGSWWAQLAHRGSVGVAER